MGNLSAESGIKEKRMDIVKFKEAFEKYPHKVRVYNKIFPKMLIGRQIVDLEYGPDADNDSQLYYIVLDNGIKIGIARVYNDPQEDGSIVKELDRTERYSDGSILRFQFHNWPKKEK